MSMRIERHVERISTVAPGHLESHPQKRELAHPLCTLQRLDPEDLNTTMCDLIQEDEKRVVAATDEESRRLHQQFLRAHGRPKGELTTLSCGSGGPLRWNSQRDE